VFPLKKNIVAPVEQQKWHTKPKEQLAAITENLERLEWFDLIGCELKREILYGHYVKAEQVA